MIDLLNRLLSQIKSKITNLVGHAIVTAITNLDSNGTTSLALQELRVQAYATEEMQGVQRIQEYGLETYPSVGHSSESDGYPEAILVSVHGNSEQALAICIGDRRYRITDLAEGEVALYTKWNSEAGRHNITMKSGQEIEMNSILLDINCTSAVSINCATANITATNGITLNTSEGGTATGLVTGESVCHFTGSPHADICANIKAEKT